MSNEKKRVEITFTAKEMDLWEWLEAQEGAKATEIKNILRKQMINETTVPIAELDEKVKVLVKQYCDEYLANNNAKKGQPVTAQEETPNTKAASPAVDLFGGREF